MKDALHDLLSKRALESAIWNLDLVLMRDAASEKGIFKDAFKHRGDIIITDKDGFRFIVSIVPERKRGELYE